MNKKEITGNLLVTIIFIVFVFVGLIACGENEKSSTKKSSVVEKPASNTKSPDGWKTFEFNDWIISVPNNWSGDKEAGVWWSGEETLDMGRPALSVHTGGIPLMPNVNFEERVISHIQGNPQERENVTVSGYDGFMCSWQIRDKKHFGIFVEEKVGSGMSIINFVDCRAPKGEFDKNKNVFTQIVKSFKKR